MLCAVHDLWRIHPNSLSYSSHQNLLPRIPILCETLRTPFSEFSLVKGTVHSPPNLLLALPCTLCPCQHIDDKPLQTGPDPDMLGNGIPGQHISSAFADGRHSYRPCYPSEMLLEKEQRCTHSVSLVPLVSHPHGVYRRRRRMECLFLGAHDSLVWCMHGSRNTRQVLLTHWDMQDRHRHESGRNESWDCCL
jgi:hypothetical protein